MCSRTPVVGTRAESGTYYRESSYKKFTPISTRQTSMYSKRKETVSISNGVLIIDSEVVFSIIEGFVKKAVAGVRSAPNSS
jgi:hypothetical protein